MVEPESGDGIRSTTGLRVRNAEPAIVGLLNLLVLLTFLSTCLAALICLLLYFAEQLVRKSQVQRSDSSLSPSGREEGGTARTGKEFIREIFEELESRARSQGPSAAPMLVDALLEAASSGNESDLMDQFVFLQTYGEIFPDALAEALVPRLSPGGPPELVMLLGHTRVAGVLRDLIATLDLSRADDELLIALACALGDLGSEEAINFLGELEQRPNLSPEVREEIRIARGVQTWRTSNPGRPTRGAEQDTPKQTL